jgi:hypothetical protein
MFLKLLIKNGSRIGSSFLLPDTEEPNQTSTPWVLEDEVIEFKISVPINFKSAILEIYQHEIEPTKIELHENNELINFTWTPKETSYGPEKLFLNYFGLSELALLLRDEEGDVTDVRYFQPLQVAAKSSSAENVERMFEYLANISSEALNSVFSATRHSAGQAEGSLSPNNTLDRVIKSVDLLQDSLPTLLNRPITRLIPQHKIISPTGNEEVDDSSIGWLLENLSVLEPDENPDQAHVFFDNQHYRAQALSIAILNENTDVYENRVIHGYVDFLTRQTQSLLQKFVSEFNSAAQVTEVPKGYTSFFSKIASFKYHLMGSQFKKIEDLLDRLKQIKHLLEQKIKVSRSFSETPIFTPRAQNNSTYMEIFVDLIHWQQRGAIDWSAYENLFAIQSIPDLFEAYSYFRVVESVNNFFNSTESNIESLTVLNTHFSNTSGLEIIIHREPEYWTPNHASSSNREIVNSEAYTVKGNYSYSLRGQRGPHTKRVPDIVIEVKNLFENTSELLVLDAKYTRRGKAFTYYLPELTMKYVHGIHARKQQSPTVSSLTILYTDGEKPSFSSYHHGDMGIFGNNPVSPDLQTINLLLGARRENDYLQKFISRLLEIHGIKRSEVLPLLQ